MEQQLKKRKLLTQWWDPHCKEQNNMEENGRVGKQGKTWRLLLRTGWRGIPSLTHCVSLGAERQRRRRNVSWHISHACHPRPFIMNQIVHTDYCHHIIVCIYNAESARKTCIPWVKRRKDQNLWRSEIYCIRQKMMLHVAVCGSMHDEWLYVERSDCLSFHILLR